MRVVRLALLALGALLFVWLLARIGLAAVATSVADLSWRLPLILCLPYAFMTTCDALGWRFAFRRDIVPFRTLLSTRLAGEAFNATTPTASVGGEAVKAWLLRPYAPLTESLPSLIVAKTTITVSQALFLLLGIAVAWATLPSGSTLLRGMEWLLLIEVLAAGGFVLVQVMGVMGGGGRMLHRLGLLGAHDRSRALSQMDHALAHFYRNEPRRLLLSIGWHFAGWTLGVLEAYALLHLLHIPVSLSTAVVIEAFETGVGFAAFLVPARLGAFEAGHVAVFAALGLGAPAGLTFSLVRRLREAVWVGVGFLALATLRSSAAARVVPLEADS